MKREDNKEQELLVRELGVFELRGLAREVGIPSPTTKKREELISMILEKFKDGAVMEHIERKKGRPFKKLSSIDDILNSITNDFNEEEKLFKVPSTYEDIITFAQEPTNFNIMDDEEKEFEGIIRQKDDFFSMLVKGKWIFFKDEKLKDKLMVGDKVKCVAKLIDMKGQYIATDIISINGIDYDKYKKEEIDNGDEIISTNKIPYGDRNLIEGRRNAYLMQEDLYENDDFSQLTKYCNKNNIKLVVLGLNISYENKILFNNLNFENFTTSYASSNEDNFNSIIDAINYVQRLMKLGDKIIFYIMDVQELLRGFDKCFMSLKEHSVQTTLLVQKIMSLGRAYSNGNSCTLFIGYNKNDENDQFVVNDILRICKKM